MGVGVATAVEAGLQFGQGAPSPQSAQNLVETSGFHLMGRHAHPIVLDMGVLRCVSRSGRPVLWASGLIDGF